MDDLPVQAMAMARAVKQARGALIDAVRRAVPSTDGPVLRAAHAQVFENLDPDGTRLTALAERAQMSHQAMGEMVAELVGYGYLERVPDPVDRRARLIRPTDLGRAELARARDQLCLIYECWQSELGALGATDVVLALDALIRICGRPPGDT